MSYAKLNFAQMQGSPGTQRGVVLFIALIVLVAMTLAGLGMMRSVDANNLIAGNLAFKNAATSAGDAAVEAARTWIAAQTPGQLETNQAGLGYFANWEPTFDPNTFDWTASSQLVGADSYGNTIRYVAHRMCNESAKSINATNCAKVINSSVGTSKSQKNRQQPKTSSLAFYRITAKVQGPKYTVSYLQAFIY
jgi:type IV pilus assembly protein PilX